MSKNKQFKYGDLFGDSYDMWRDTWFSNGHNTVANRDLTVKDTIMTPNAREWMPRLVREIAVEPVEPLLIIPSLFDEIEYQPLIEYHFPSISAMEAAEVGEGQAYPERSLNIVPGSMTVGVGKTGLALKISEEMMSHATFDIINMHVRQMARALARKKEQKGFNMMSGLGTTLFDNLTPSQSVFGVTTGRSITGSANGSVTMRDLMKSYAYLMQQGFIPNLLLMSPMMWSMWLVDPLLSKVAQNVGNAVMFQQHQIPRQSKLIQSQVTKTGLRTAMPGSNVAGETATPLAEIDPTYTSKPSVPSYFPYPLTILVSPFMPFDVDNEIGDIILADSSAIGALAVEEGVSMDEWTDLSVDITKIKLKEKYGMFMYDEGRGLAVMRNIPIEHNEIAFPAQATISASGEYSAINPLTPISL